MTMAQMDSVHFADLKVTDLASL